MSLASCVFLGGGARGGALLVFCSPVVAENCDALRSLVPYVQFKKREKHPWMSFNSSKVAGFKPSTLLELTLLYGCFPRFLNCTYGTKSRNAPRLCLRINLFIFTNRFQANTPINQRFSDVFRGYNVFYVTVANPAF